MKTLDDELAELDKELEQLQSFKFKPITEAELLNFVIEAKSDILALTHHICGVLAKLNGTKLHDEKKKLSIIQKARRVEVLKKRISKTKTTN